MAIQIIPREPSVYEQYGKPWLELAMQTMLQRKMEEQQYQRNIQRANQMFPGLMQPSPQMQPAPGAVSQYATPQGQIPTKPAIPKQYQFNMQEAQQYPGMEFNPITGETSYKVPSTIGNMPIINITPEGKLEPIGTAPKGARVLTPSQMETPGQKQQREVKTAQEKGKLPTADIKNLAKQAELQLENVRALKNEASQLPGGYQGLTLRGKAIATRGKVGGNLYAYERKLPAFAAGLYRALTGDNRLSDMDAQQRALPLLWNTSIDISLREPMFKFLEQALTIRKKLLEQGNYTLVDGIPFTPLEQILQSSQQQSQFNFSNMSTEQLLKRKQELLQGGGR